MIAAATLVASMAVAQSAGGDDLSSALALLERVDAAMVDIEWNEAELGDVLAELAASLNIPVHGDWRALDRLGIDEDDAVTMRAEAQSGAAVLNGLCIILGDDFERPIFEPSAGRLIFTTIKGSASLRHTAVYDVGDLLNDGHTVADLRESANSFDPPPPPPTIAPPANQSGDQPSQPDALDAQDGQDRAESGAQSDEGDGDAQTGEAASERTVDPIDLTPGERLMYLIMDHVDPDSWMTVGGLSGKISERDGLIIVTAAPGTHRRIQQVLERLRQANAAAIEVELTLVQLPQAALDRITRHHRPASVALATGLTSAPEGTVLSTSTAMVAMGKDARFDVTDSSAGPMSMLAGIAPVHDAASGLLNIRLEVELTTGEDRRAVKTTLALRPTDVSAYVLLPSADPKANPVVAVVQCARR